RMLTASKVVAALSLLAVAAWASTAGTPTLEEKVKLLQDSLYRKPVLNLNMEKWRNLVRSQPRNYSMMVMFTALSTSVNCPICKPAYDEFFILANSYRYAHADSRSLYFAIVDYEEAPNVFQQMNLNTAPILYHFGPKLTGKKKPEQMDFQRHGFDADAMARFVHDQTEHSIRVLRPPNYAAPVIILLLAMLVLGLLYMRRNNLEFLYNRTFWATVCVGMTFVFMSGQMWNHIRGPPFFMTNPNTRETQYIHSSTQYQLVGETYIVACLYAAITFGFILMNDSAVLENIKEALKSRKSTSALSTPPYAWVSIGLAMVAFFFSALLSVFRSKYSGYPYSFLFS
ncbi:hypothetical protein PFISCL1PPCAC_12340, partial [Pristionchus fissidentatus]